MATPSSRPAAAAPVPIAAPTPMMAQYHALKAEAADCLLFYRMGDFFELFFEDAVTAAGVLDIALTRRGEQGGEAVPMCGVPVHAAETYLARLIRAGHRVAIAEQVETPAEARAARGSKALVERAIVRFVTAGTLTEEALLSPRRSNWIMAVAFDGGGDGGGDGGHDRRDVAGARCAIAAADVSTGHWRVASQPLGDLAAAIARHAPAELIHAPEAPPPSSAVPPGTVLTAGAAEAFTGAAGAAALTTLLGPDGAAGLSPLELAAAGGLIAYLRHAACGADPFLLPLTDRAGGTDGADGPDGAGAAPLAIDASSLESLEVVTGAAGGRAGSLLAAIDRTVTGAGARLLAEDLVAPLGAADAITARLDLVDWMRREEGAAGRIVETLGRTPDLARALGRLAAGRGTPRDLGQVRDGLTAARALAELVAGAADAPPLLTELGAALTGHGALVDELTRALVPAPPALAGEGGYIAEGYDAALDALRQAAQGGRRAIAALEADYRQRTGIPTLKVRHNAVIGYHVEVSAGRADALLREGSGFTHRQTLAGSVRFNTPELHEAARRVVEAGAHASLAEAAHAEALTERVLADRVAIAATAAALARLDVASALAAHAAAHGWCRPELVDAPCLEVTGGRHPVVEAALAREGRAFVPNDLSLSPADRLWLLTGPNMGGKSTFLRQNALIVLLAQAGSFVPASRCRLGLVDRLFSRVGAADNLARGRSTFMVEMVETAAILVNATARSFVILDEVGRGTSTYDGLALAWAVVEAVVTRNRCRCLFATHYHELVRLAEQHPALSNHHVRAREWRGELVFLHAVAAGAADRSYGLSVARLAGVPPTVVARAADVLARLEAGRARTGGLAAGLDDLPLFAGLPGHDDGAEGGGDGRAAGTPPPDDALRAALRAIDPDALSPREAHARLVELCALADGVKG